MSRARGAKNRPKETIQKIMQMHYEQGITRKEIAIRLCMPYKTVKNIITRENNKKKKKEYPVLKIPGHRGRPRKLPVTAEQAMKLRIRELEREVELYKSFLQAAGRM